MRLPYNRLFILVLAVGCVVAICALPDPAAARAGGCGRSCRTASSPRSAASPPSRVDQLTFFIGSGLAGVAGVALTLIGPVGPNLGTVLHRGRLPGRRRRRASGQLRGAVLAALALGVLNSYVEFWTDASLAKVVVFAVIVAFLQVRPQGLFVLRTRALS